MAIKLNRISPSLYLKMKLLFKKKSSVEIPSTQNKLDAYFCIRFSMTGRTALIQSSWLHAPEEVTKSFQNMNQLHKVNNSPLSPSTEVYGSFTESVQLIKSSVNRHVAHEVKSILFFSRRLCVELKHLLSTEKRKMTKTLNKISNREKEKRKFHKSK